jgi:translocator protein
MAHGACKELQLRSEEEKMKIKWAALALFILLSLSAGAIGSIFTLPAISGWYASLAKPSFSPPNWLFGPVWTTLYVLMGISAYVVWKKGAGEKAANIALIIFAMQLVLNLEWSVVFFGMRSPHFALLAIFALWLMIVATIREFYKIDRRAAYLLVPYILWVSFAAVLNYFVWVLNP